MDQPKIRAGVRMILAGLSVDIDDKNFIETPDRVARFLTELFTPKETEWATFPENYNDFIALRNHFMYSLCPHHLLPVEFKVTVAYVPNGHVLGLSKLARLLDECNTGPILQEKFTQDVVKRVKTICPSSQGAACIIEGRHDCTKIRGVKSDGSFLTYKLDGVFLERPDLEQRFFELARR